MVRVWPWLMLAACSSEGSIEILVTSPGVAVTKVEVFIGVHDEQLEAIRPQQGPLSDAVWWKRDRSLDKDIQPMDEGGVLFQFTPGGSLGDSIAAMVVVGYGESADTGRLNPVAVATQMLWTDIPSDEIHHYDFELVAAQPLPGSSAMPGVLVWGPSERLATTLSEKREADPHACVQVDSIRELAEYKYPVTDAIAQSGMIVTGNDPDCDGLIDRTAPAPDTECVANEYMGQNSMTRSTLGCLIPTRFGSALAGVQGCVVGGGTCVDGPGMAAGSCSPSAYCMPTPACSGCMVPDCDPYKAPGTPYLYCKLYRNDQMASPGDSLCPVTTRLDLTAVLPALGLVCDTERPAMLRRARNSAWQTTYPFSIAPSGGSPAVINVLPGSKNCEFLFTPGGGPLPLDNQYFPISESGGTLSIPLGPKQDGRGLMLPIAFDVVSPPQADCNASTTSHPADCTLMLGSAADPGLEMCVDAELVSGTQVREDP